MSLDNRSSASVYIFSVARSRSNVDFRQLSQICLQIARHTRKPTKQQITPTATSAFRVYMSSPPINRMKNICKVL
nr:MAG TPA: hypothetical protein [Caudoviricetes sp.]DAM88123.1 MAG TPA: hypothetical protein [Caudoviricetes sp.]